ncbi:MAG: HEPN domain-containing protein [Treponemataceae bacterium]
MNEDFKNNSANYDGNLRLKLYRALSWLNEADRQKDCLDFCFISLWISFNAVYADELSFFQGRQDLKAFLKKVCSLDKNNILYSLVWNNFSNNIRLFLKNKFIFQPFWDALNNPKKEQAKNWEKEFKRDNKRALKAMGDLDTAKILNIIFGRLYTLRNQILHGGATFESSTNIAQKKEACTFLLNILPAIIKIIMDNAGVNWGQAYYPVVES